MCVFVEFWAELATEWTTETLFNFSPKEEKNERVRLMDWKNKLKLL